MSDKILENLADVTAAANEMLELVRECGGAEIHRDEWPVAEALASDGKIFLGSPRGPGGDWRRAALTAEESRT